MKNTAIDINESTIKNYVESIRPKEPEIRNELDFSYTFDGKTAILYEVRPFFDDPKQKMHLEFAKIRFYKSRKEWNLYWMRASGKWEAYEPLAISSHLDKIIQEIKEDKFGCFFG